MCITVCTITKCIECEVLLEKSYSAMVPCSAMRKDGVCTVTDILTNTILENNEECRICVYIKEEEELISRRACGS
jgi:hypothetical protein